jgi:hypothetical protein
MVVLSRIVAGFAAALAGWAAGEVWYGGVRTACSTVDN